MEDDKKEETEKVKIKSYTDLQRLKLEKLMKNPNKPVIIPESPKKKTAFSVPEFVRNVTGSSAGAGSGEFHVYRHLRRKEYSRQHFIQQLSEKERLDKEYQEKMERLKQIAEEKTAKKRAKRLKKKQKNKKPKLSNETVKEENDTESDDSDDEKSENYKTENKEQNEVDNKEQNEDIKDENERNKSTINELDNSCSKDLNRIDDAEIEKD